MRMRPLIKGGDVRLQKLDIFNSVNLAACVQKPPIMMLMPQECKNTKPVQYG